MQKYNPCWFYTPHPPKHSAVSRIFLMFPVIFATMAAMALISHQAYAGPWSKDTGQFYVKTSQGFFVADRFVTERGESVQGAQFFGTQTSLYFEIGLVYGFQIQGSMAYSLGQIHYQGPTSAENSFYRLNGPSDAIIGLQWTPPPFLKRLHFPMALRVDFKIPMYNAGGLQRDVGMQATNFPALGDGQLDITFWISLGGSIPKTPLYLFAEVGYRFRTEAFIGDNTSFTFFDTLVFQSQFGWNFWQRMVAALSFQGTIPLGQNLYTKGNLSLGLSLYLPVWRGLALEASFDPMVWAQASARGISFGLGLSYQQF